MALCSARCIRLLVDFVIHPLSASLRQLQGLFRHSFKGMPGWRFYDERNHHADTGLVEDGLELCKITSSVGASPSCSSICLFCHNISLLFIYERV